MAKLLSAKQESYFAKDFTIQQFISLHRTHPSSNSLASTSDIYCKANFVQRCQIDISVLTVRNITSGSLTKRSLFTGRYAHPVEERAWFNNSPKGKRESPPSLRPKKIMGRIAPWAELANYLRTIRHKPTVHNLLVSYTKLTFWQPDALLPES